jgi:large subunit ribosomal protein L2
MVRAAGAGAQLMARDGGWAQVKLPSGEVRKVHVECYATVGQVGNLEHENVSIGKAGRNRWWAGARTTVASR